MMHNIHVCSIVLISVVAQHSGKCTSRFHQVIKLVSKVLYQQGLSFRPNNSSYLFL
ncbi:Nodule-specific Glycine Rich Peptide [Medicago truncatula]|uniref:Nodule-specific Glycine Rich Peptide n=1 Tax=Medicago truncatula TaxID=3880 RepID=A0A072UXN3_MEDTR|nr:Nodule-specific Glycine Rich Peptide [Medicago truncatula]